MAPTLKLGHSDVGSNPILGLLLNFDSIKYKKGLTIMFKSIPFTNDRSSYEFINQEELPILNNLQYELNRNGQYGDPFHIHYKGKVSAHAVRTSTFRVTHATMMAYLINIYNPGLQIQINGIVMDIPSETTQFLKTPVTGTRTPEENTLLFTTQMIMARPSYLTDFLYTGLDVLAYNIHILRTGIESITIINKNIPHFKNLEMFLLRSANHRLAINLGTSHSTNPATPNFTSQTVNVYTNIYAEDQLRAAIALTPTLIKDFPNIILPEEVWPIFEAYGETTDTNWLRLYNEWYIKNNINKRFILNRIKTTIPEFFRYVVQNYARSKEETSRRIAEYEQQLAERYQQLQKVMAQEMFTEEALAAQQDQFIDYVSKCSAVVDIIQTRRNNRNTGASENMLVVSINNPLDYYDIEAAKSVLRQLHRISTGLTEKIIRILELIYIDQVATLYTSSVIGFSQFSVNALAYECDGISMKSTHLPHPHLNEHHCLGSNRSLIEKELSKQNFIEGFTQILAATHNINFLDSTVLNTLIERMKNCLSDENSRNAQKPTIEYPAGSGTMLTINKFWEAIKS